ncbi:MAG: heparan-alpha-glucosaminide N-acetyltransferase [Comamonas sp.]
MHSLSPPFSTNQFARLDRLDALRGLAMVWMTVFHFAFDLSYLRIWPQDFYNDPLWTWQRAAIVSLFLWCAGMGQAAASARHVPLARFMRRWATIAGCALLVSAGSYFIFPHSYIYFGVLHGIAVMLLVLRLMRSTPAAALLAAAAVAIALPPLYRYLAPESPAQLVQLLNSKALSPLGLITIKPRTEDYVPLLPWLGVMLLGFAAGRRVLAMPTAAAWWSKPARGVVSGLAWLGRHSLPYYMMHQLVLLGTLMLAVQIFR